jgi:hypothetical protein
MNIKQAMNDLMSAPEIGLNRCNLFSLAVRLDIASAVAR